MSVVASFASRTSLARHLTHELGALGAAENLYYVNIRFALAKLQLFGLATWFFALVAVTGLAALLAAGDRAPANNREGTRCRDTACRAA